MSSVRDLHLRAMRFARMAMVIARNQGDEKAEPFLRKAFFHARRAANLLPDEAEPARSILYLSAASLALQCKANFAAMELARKGLAGSPSPYIEGELNALIEAIEHANPDLPESRKEDRCEAQAMPV